MKLYDTNFKPSFSGHETFPLRHGWLKKAYDFIKNNESTEGKNPFANEHAIAFFGVGKNMVISIRHWAQLAGITEEGKNQEITTSEIADSLLSQSGDDPYFENPNSVWLTHFNVASNPSCTSWYWLFNHFNEIEFSRETIQSSLKKFIDDRGWKAPSDSTLKRDVDCLLRFYTTSKNKDGSVQEDSMDSLCSELLLLQKSETKNQFRLNRAEKHTLGDHLFFYCLALFWARYSSSDSISLEAICFEPGSPGRIFLLDEESIITRLMNASKITDRAFNWSETAGLKQIIKNVEIDQAFLRNLFSKIYLDVS